MYLYIVKLALQTRLCHLDGQDSNNYGMQRLATVG